MRYPVELVTKSLENSNGNSIGKSGKSLIKSEKAVSRCRRTTKTITFTRLSIILLFHANRQTIFYSAEN